MMIAIHLLAYILGGVLVGQLVLRNESADGDVRCFDAEGVLAQKGFALAGLVFVADWAKAVLLVSLLPMVQAEAAWMTYSIAIAVLVGHIFSPFARLSGGMPLAITLGVLTVVMPYALIGWIAAWLVTIFASGYRALAALVAAGTLPLYAALFAESVGDRPQLGLAMVLLAMTIYCRRPSIRAMQLGKEPKVNLSALFGRVQ